MFGLLNPTKRTSKIEQSNNALKTGSNLRTLFIDNYIQDGPITAHGENPYNGKEYSQEP